MKWTSFELSGLFRNRIGVTVQMFRQAFFQMGSDARLTTPYDCMGSRQDLFKCFVNRSVGRPNFQYFSGEWGSWWSVYRTLQCPTNNISRQSLYTASVEPPVSCSAAFSGQYRVEIQARYIRCEITRGLVARWGEVCRARVRVGVR